MTKLYAFDITYREGQTIDHTCFNGSYVGEDIGLGSWASPGYPVINTHTPSSVDLQDKTAWQK